MSEESSAELAKISVHLEYIRAALVKSEQTNEELCRDVANMKDRMSKLETAFNESAPTLKQFVSIKDKIVGAGWLGKILWGGFCGVLGWIYSSRVEIISWLSRSGH